MYPILFMIGSFPVRTYGVLHGIAYAVAIWWLVREARKARMDPDMLFDFSGVVVVWSLVGARVFSILFDDNLQWYVDHPMQILAVWNGGLTFYGGFMFALAAGIWFINKHHVRGWQIADFLAPAIALGAAIGRLGCFASGDSYGKPTNVAWAVTFTDPAAMAPLGVPLHPTQLYSTATNLAVFGALLWWRKRQKFEGELFLVLMVLYAITRFVVEIFRDDPRGVYLNGLVSTSQIVSLLVFGVALVLYVRRSRSTIIASGAKGFERLKKEGQPA